MPRIQLTKQTSEELGASLERNDALLSRTVLERRIDTSVSDSKASALTEEGELLATVARNRESVARYVHDLPIQALRTGTELLACVITIASLNVQGMRCDTLLRTWPLPTGRLYGPPEDSVVVEPEVVWQELQVVTDIAVQMYGTDSLGAAAYLEWQIGIGPLHPFYDACGRTSRAVSAMVLTLAGEPIRTHRSRDEYFKEGTRGVRAFGEYFRSL